MGCEARDIVSIRKGTHCDVDAGLILTNLGSGMWLIVGDAPVAVASRQPRIFGKSMCSIDWMATGMAGNSSREVAKGR